VLVTPIRALSLTSELFEVPAPHALGTLLVVGGLTKAGFPDLAVAAMLVTYLLYVATRQIIIFITSFEADGGPETAELARRRAAHRARIGSV
jgi:hypothetical protein